MTEDNLTDVLDLLEDDDDQEKKSGQQIDIEEAIAEKLKKDEMEAGSQDPKKDQDPPKKKRGRPKKIVNEVVKVVNEDDLADVVFDFQPLIQKLEYNIEQICSPLGIAYEFNAEKGTLTLRGGVKVVQSIGLNQPTAAIIKWAQSFCRN